MEGETSSAFNEAITQVQSSLVTNIGELTTVIVAVATAAIVIFLIPWGVKKIRSALTKAS